MAECKHHKICGLDALEGSGEELCILHSHNPEKDKNAFDAALAEHRKQNGDNFRYFVFPGLADSSRTTFTEWNLRGESLKIATKTAMRREEAGFFFLR
ncbi:MAG: hypothetical protein ACLQPD_26385 [Desulfomonilaceae bacterium]